MLRPKLLSASVLVVMIAGGVTYYCTRTDQMDKPATTELSVRLLRHPMQTARNRVRYGGQAILDTLPNASRLPTSSLLGDTKLQSNEAALLEICNTSGRKLVLSNCSRFAQVGKPKCFAIDKNLYDPDGKILERGDGPTIGPPSIDPGDSQKGSTLLPWARHQPTTTISPDERVEYYIDPTEWFEFDKPGIYQCAVTVAWLESPHFEVKELTTNFVDIAIMPADVADSQLHRKRQREFLGLP